MARTQVQGGILAPNVDVELVQGPILLLARVGDQRQSMASKVTMVAWAEVGGGGAGKEEKEIGQQFCGRLHFANSTNFFVPHGCISQF